MSNQHLVNPEAIAMAIQAVAGFSKQAFVPAGDPAMDPSAAGGCAGAPPGAAPPPGGDPSGGGGGGAPPPPPPPDTGAIVQQVMQLIQSQGGMGGGGGGMEPIKPKIDVNVTLLQILKILAKIADTLGVQIPASEMVATQSDLTNFGMQQQTGAAGGPAGGAGGAGGAGPGSAISPIQPMQGASPQLAGGKSASYAAEGQAFDTEKLGQVSNRASAIRAFWNARNTKPAA